MTETPNPHIVDSDTLTGEMRPIRRAVLSLGSNLGERMASIQGAVHALADTPDVWVTGASPVYETEPVNCPPGSDNFYNAIVLIDTTLASGRLLDRAHAIEDAFGRERGEGIEVNAPRNLDVDIIVIGDRRADDETLTLPAPSGRRARLRAPALVRHRAGRRAARLRTDRRAPGEDRSQRPEAARRLGPAGPITLSLW